MTALTNPLSVDRGVLWVGASPPPDGRGIALTPDHLALHDIDVDPKLVPWSDVRGLTVVVEVSRWRRPALASWTLGMLGAAIDIFSPGLPDDVDLRIETASGQIEHTANAHNRGGYPKNKVDALIAFLDLLVVDGGVRASLSSPDTVREAFGRASEAVNRGESPTRVLLSLVT